MALGMPSRKQIGRYDLGRSVLGRMQATNPFEQAILWTLSRFCIYKRDLHSVRSPFRIYKGDLHSVRSPCEVVWQTTSKTKFYFLQAVKTLFYVPPVQQRYHHASHRFQVWQVHGEDVPQVQRTWLCSFTHDERHLQACWTERRGHQGTCKTRIIWHFESSRSKPRLCHMITRGFMDNDLHPAQTIRSSLKYKCIFGAIAKHKVPA